MADGVVFFVARIGEPGSQERFESDLALEMIVAPAARAAGFEETIRADQVDRAGRITTDVVNSIADGGAVVADLTGRNPNVFYELAIAHAAHKPTIQLVEQSELGSLPFDVVEQSTISYRRGDIKSYLDARERVTKQLARARASEPIENPIVTARLFKALQIAVRSSGETDTKEIFSAFSQLLRTTSRSVPLIPAPIRSMEIQTPQKTPAELRAEKRLWDQDWEKKFAEEGQERDQVLGTSERWIFNPDQFEKTIGGAPSTAEFVEISLGESSDVRIIAKSPMGTTFFDLSGDWVDNLDVIHFADPRAASLANRVAEFLNSS